MSIDQVIQTSGIAVSILLGSAGIIWALWGVKKQMWLTQFLTLTVDRSRLLSEMDVPMHFSE